MNITRTCPPVEIIIFYTPITSFYIPAVPNNTPSFSKRTATDSPPNEAFSEATCGRVIQRQKTNEQNIFPGKALPLHKHQMI